MQDFNEQFNADDMLPDEDNMEELHEDLFGEEDEEEDWKIVDDDKEENLPISKDYILLNQTPPPPQRQTQVHAGRIRGDQPKNNDDLTITY
jgi:hypothetical protein